MLDILYLDNFICVCNKPRGILSEGEGRDALPSLLAEELASLGKGTSVYPVHRLDRLTEGLMVYALDKRAAASLSADIADGKMEKEYIAELCGIPEQKEGQLRDLLFFDRQKGRSFVVARERKGVKEAILDYRIISTTDKYATVRVHLITGRTHQIRAQFASRGLPLRGDRRYGARDDSKELALRACYLKFTHPITKKEMEFGERDTVKEKKTEMEKGKYKYLIASDLDGTLIQKEQISPENSLAIEELGKRGVCFAVCSGRCFGEMPKAVLENPHIRYYIGADGSEIWDKKEDIRAYIAMDKTLTAKAMDIIECYKTLPTVRYKGVSYADGDMCDEESYKACRAMDFHRYILYYSVQKENFSQYIRSLDQTEMICAFFANAEDRLECKNRLEATGEFTVTCSHDNNLEIVHKNAGKGNGMLALADMLGISHENTIAVGDSGNDMDMIKKAGLSLAMENACDELKEMSDLTICHYEEHSAKYILEKVLAGKI